MPSLDIPDSFPLASILGQEVTQVCVGLHHVRLNFYKPVASSVGRPQWESGASIDIEAGFELLDPDGDVHVANNEALGLESSCLLALLGRTVTIFERLERNELSFHFSGGYSLRLRTDPAGLESYHLHVEGESVDVTAC